MSLTNKRLDELLRGLPSRRHGSSANPEITGICVDSRQAKAGDLFVAIKGAKQDGHDYAERVVRQGVVAVLAEKQLDLPVPVDVVPSTLKALSLVAARFYENPSGQMSVWGVTGTNGKTTVTYMLENIWRRHGWQPGVVGTVEYRWRNKQRAAANTTPLSLDLQKLLAEMKDEGVTHVAMEVSSHGLALSRVEDVSFAGAIFTNLTQDHLDFHHSMDDYFLAKAHLFELLAASAPTENLVKCAIINADDPWSAKLRRFIANPIITYAVNVPAQVSATEVSLDSAGTTFQLTSPQGRFPCRLPLVGEHNVYNALAAAAAAIAAGIPVEEIVPALEELRGVPGRLERVGPPSAPFRVFVDYAHTPDALKNVLTALRPITAGHLTVVFGCGGDRDRGKRPLMGEIAVQLADHVIVTSDNPRSEDPQRIALDIEVGARRARPKGYEIVVDRATAIQRALESAKAGDVVLIAGKGHETYQIFSDRTIHFDDREIAEAAMWKMSS